MNRLILTLLLGCLVMTGCADKKSETFFTNPVIRGDVPDPSIIRIGETYYATGTSSEWAPYYPVFTSTDLVNWTQTGHIFDKQPEWTVSSFWAPELFYHNDSIFCYYTARRASDGTSFIGVATAKSPTDKFTDHGVIIEWGTEAIDAFAYEDNGQLYISWKAYGLDDRPIEIIGSKLSADGLRLEGEPFTLLVDDERVGMEGQYHFKHGEYYYIIYAARGCCGPGSDYEVCVARSKSVEGPFEKYEKNPILVGGGKDFQSCGHGTVTTTPDGRMFYMCHAYLSGTGFYAGRQPILQEIVMGDDKWLHFATGDTATLKQPMPFKGTVQLPPANFEDDFQSETRRVEWTWNYVFSDIEARSGGGKLILSGIPKKDSHYGTAMCLRAVSPNYTYETQVINDNESLKGLTMYGDDKNMLAWGKADDRLILRSVKNGQESILKEMAIEGPVYLKVEVADYSLYSFFWSTDGKEWNQLDDAVLNAKALIRWDRVSRPGLIQNGPQDKPAEFSYFKLTNI